MTATPCATAQPHYLFGAFLATPYEVSLRIDPAGLTIEQFRTDMPRIAARLEGLIMEAHAKGEQP